MTDGRTDRQTDRRINSPPQGSEGGAKSVLLHTPSMRETHTKFGWISSIGLGGDSVTVGRTDRGDYNIMV